MNSDDVQIWSQLAKQRDEAIEMAAHARAVAEAMLSSADEETAMYLRSSIRRMRDQRTREGRLVNRLTASHREAVKDAVVGSPLHS